jgi:hypothetical protein
MHSLAFLFRISERFIGLSDRIGKTRPDESRRSSVRDQDYFYNGLINNELHRIPTVIDRFILNLEPSMQRTKLRELGKKRWGKRFLNQSCRVTLVRGPGDPLIGPLIFLKGFLAPFAPLHTTALSWVGEVGTVSCTAIPSR